MGAGTPRRVTIDYGATTYRKKANGWSVTTLAQWMSEIKLWSALPTAALWLANCFLKAES